MSTSPSPSAALNGEQKQAVWRENGEQEIGLNNSEPVNGDDHHILPAQDPENPVDYARGSSVGDASIPPKPDLEPPVFREKQVKVLRSSLLTTLSSSSLSSSR